MSSKGLRCVYVRVFVVSCQGVRCIMLMYYFVMSGRAMCLGGFYDASCQGVRFF